MKPKGENESEPENEQFARWHKNWTSSR